MMTNYQQLSMDYLRVEQAILFLEKNFRSQPDLKEIAGSVGLSEYHFQRLFTRWAGISPKRFLQFLAVNYAKQLLGEAKSVLDVTYETGLSSPGRLHDLFVTHEAVTPGEFKQNGAGLSIAYGLHPTPFGECLLAVTERGICGLSFAPDQNRDKALVSLKSHWPQAQFYADAARTRPLAEQIFSIDTQQYGEPPLNLYLKGTNFQIKVWQALLKIPPGMVVSYNDVAVRIGQPGAGRAIGRATAQNPIGFLIPCHRVIRKVGQFGDYRWGSARKKAILGWEASRRYRQIAAH